MQKLNGSSSFLKKAAGISNNKFPYPTTRFIFKSFQITKNQDNYK